MTTKKVKAGGEVTVNASEHTPTPWEIRPRADQTPTAYVFAKGLDTQVGYIGLMSSPENAAHIVKCVNSHDALLAELKNVRCEECFVNFGYSGAGSCKFCEDVREVIAKAEEK